MGDLLNAEELAEKLGISVATLYRNLKDGSPKKGKHNALDIQGLPSTYISGKRFWHKSCVEEALKNLSGR